jgi:hypothetical protein
MTAGAGGRGACVGYTADWAAWRPVDNPGCSIKPYQVFIGADVEHELTFGLDHSMGAGQLAGAPTSMSWLAARAGRPSGSPQPRPGSVPVRPSLGLIGRTLTHPPDRQRSIGMARIPIDEAPRHAHGCLPVSQAVSNPLYVADRPQSRLAPGSLCTPFGCCPVMSYDLSCLKTQR